MLISNDLSNMHVLCLDPEREWLNILSVELKAVGLRQIMTTTDPKKALEFLQLGNIDLVLINHNPKFVRLLRRSKSSPNPRIPVIVLTHQISWVDIFTIRDAGANEIVIKPCSVKQIISRIKTVAAHPREFVTADQFIGPDRRRSDILLSGPNRRKGKLR